MPVYFRGVILVECGVYTVVAVGWEYGVVRCLVRLTNRRKNAVAEETALGEYRRSLLNQAVLI